MICRRCNRCGKEVPKTAAKCPSCGWPLKRKGMGLISSFTAIIFFLVLFFVIGKMFKTGPEYVSPGKPQQTAAQKVVDMFGEPMPSDFRVSGFGIELENDHYSAVGEIKNVGKISAGPKVQVIARDKNGLIISNKSFWPNDFKNLLPGATCSINHSLTQDPNVDKAEIRVVSVQVWDK